MPTIGIDLGTVNSCVAAFRNGNIEVIPNDLGDHTTPSYVAFHEDERLIGKLAKDKMAKYPENTIYDVKRLIGRNYDDKSVTENQHLWGFKVLNDNNKPIIQVQYQKEHYTFCPEQLSAMVLEKMKEIAKIFLGMNVRDAVITVPAYFNDAQRSATHDAGTIAGLNVLCIINEPTAAAIAYGYNKESNRNVLVFDFGGGTFDVTVLRIENDFFDVKATGGDTNLGGEDINNRTFNHLAEEFLKQTGKDLRSDKRAVCRLRDACEQAKIELSVSLQASVCVDAIFQGIDFNTTITRATFEQLNDDIFRRTIGIVQTTLEDANMKKDEIDDVLLVGGSTRIKKIEELLQSFFNGKDLKKTVNQNEAIAIGAATHAAFLDGEYDNIKLQDVTPLSLGIEANNRDMEVLIPHNTKIPAHASKVLGTLEHHQKSVEIQIYEGERALTKDNNYLGSVELKKITPSKKKRTLIDLCFDVDANGILHVSLKERGKKREVKEKIRSHSRLTKTEIDNMIEGNIELKKQDEKLKTCSKEMNNLEKLVHCCRISLEKHKNKKKSVQDRKQISEKCDEVLEWLKTSKAPVVELKTLRKKHNELLKLATPLLASSKEFLELDSAARKLIPERVRDDDLD